jgi:hypothetical protein
MIEHYHTFAQGHYFIWQQWLVISHQLTYLKNLMGNVFLHQNIHKYTWTSSDRKMHNQIDQILMDGIWHSNMIFQWSCDVDHYLVVAEVWERLLISK